jgi:hypothetical protein
MPCSGVTLKGEVTWALPPPVSAGAGDAAGPITATVPAPFADSGSVPPVFFSSTVPASATAVETAWCWSGHNGAGRSGWRVVELVELEHLGQDPGHHIVQRGLGYLAGLHCRLKRRAVELGGGHLLVHARRAAIRQLADLRRRLEAVASRWPSHSPTLERAETCFVAAADCFTEAEQALDEARGRPRPG